MLCSISNGMLAASSSPGTLSSAVLSPLQSMLLLHSKLALLDRWEHGDILLQKVEGTILQFVPVHLFTQPALAWQILLVRLEQSLDLLSVWPPKVSSEPLLEQILMPLSTQLSFETYGG